MLSIQHNKLYYCYRVQHYLTSKLIFTSLVPHVPSLFVSWSPKVIRENYACIEERAWDQGYIDVIEFMPVQQALTVDMFQKKRLKLYNVQKDALHDT